MSRRDQPEGKRRDGSGAGLLRRLRQSAAARWLIARLGAGYIRLIQRSTRWTVEGLEIRDRLAAETPGFIAAIWHGRLLMSATWAPPGRRTVAMISNNNDGDLIAAVVGRFRVTTVRGSTYDRAKQRDKGGAEAFVGAFRELTENRAVVAITPDGPRGPRMRAQAGAAQLAIEAGVAVLPVAFSTRRGKVLRSWDRFFVPWPFSRGALVYGEPLLPPEDRGAEAMERHRCAIEAALIAVTERADALCERETPVPGPALEPVRP